MESLIAKAGDALVGAGLLGVLLLFAGMAIVALWRQNGAIQQARLADAKEMAQVLERNTVETRLTAQVVGQVLSGMQQSAQQSQILISEIRTAIADARPRR